MTNANWFAIIHFNGQKRVNYGQNGVKEMAKKENKDIVYESHNDSFSKSNSLIGSKYKASLLEQKLLNIVLARLQQRNYIDKGETGGLVCEVRAKELKEMLGTTSGNFYAQLKPAAAAMTSRTIGFVNDDIEAFKYISLISSAEYSGGTLTVKFNHELKQYLTPQTQFTMLDLPTLLHYRSIYSLRLHEILLSRCYKQKRVGAAKYTSKATDGKHYKIEFNLSELKLSLGVVNAESTAVKKILSGSPAPDYDKAVEKALEKSFSTWYDMRRKVIETAVKEINATDNGMSVTYEPLHAGRGGKVYGVCFYVDLTDEKEKSEKKESKQNKIALSEDEMFEVQVAVKTMIKESLSLKDIRAICTAAGYDFEKIKTAYEVACHTGHIENLVGFMIQAIKEEYKVTTTKKQSNAFHNFNQRDYDFDVLEKELLNV